MSVTMISGPLKIKTGFTGRTRVTCLRHRVSTVSPAWWSPRAMTRYWDLVKFEADHAACVPPKGTRDQ